MARPQTFNEKVILDKAVNLFWQKGYYNTTAQDLTEALGLNRSSIYNTFVDKRSLFIKSLMHYRQRDSRGLLNYLATAEPNRESIRQLLESIVENAFKTETIKGCFIVNTATELGYHDKDIQKIIHDNIDEVVLAFQQFIEKMQKNGAISFEKDSKALAIFLFHSITAIRVTTKIVSDKQFFNQNIEATMQLFY